MLTSNFSELRGARGVLKSHGSIEQAGLTIRTRGISQQHRPPQEPRSISHARSVQ